MEKDKRLNESFIVVLGIETAKIVSGLIFGAIAIHDGNIVLGAISIFSFLDGTGNLVRNAIDSSKS